LFSCLCDSEVNRKGFEDKERDLKRKFVLFLIFACFSGVYTHEPLRPIPNVVVPVRTRIVLGVTHASRGDVEAIAREVKND
jgi:hypothetical protein